MNLFGYNLFRHIYFIANRKMPFRIDKKRNGKYKLYNLDKKRYAKREFNSRAAAQNMKKTYMNYDTRKRKSKY